MYVKEEKKKTSLQKKKFWTEQMTYYKNTWNEGNQSPVLQRVDINRN